MKTSLFLSLRIRRVISLFAAFAVVLVCSFVNVNVARAEGNGDDNAPENVEQVNAPAEILPFEDEGGDDETDPEYCDETYGYTQSDLDATGTILTIDIASHADGGDCLQLLAPVNEDFDDIDFLTKGGAQNGITKVVFNNLGSVKTLAINSLFLMQYSDDESYEHTSQLKDINFPEGLENLIIGNEAFAQVVATPYKPALEFLTFPETLTELTIGKGAFEQFSSTNTVLKQVIFPNNLETLTIKDSAFMQVAGDVTSLESVYFPDSIISLSIGEGAFGQAIDGEPMMGRVSLHDFYFDFDETSVSSKTIQLDKNITLMASCMNVTIKDAHCPQASISPMSYTGDVQTDIGLNAIWKWRGEDLDIESMLTAWNVKSIADEGTAGEFGYTVFHADGPSGPEINIDVPGVNGNTDNNASVDSRGGLANTGVGTYPYVLILLTTICLGFGLSSRVARAKKK